MHDCTYCCAWYNNSHGAKSMRNCFKYGTIGEQWKQIQSERWFNPAFEEFINREIIPTVKENK